MYEESIKSSSSTEPEQKPDNICHQCGGVGFIHPSLPGGDPDYSRVVACDCRTRKTSQQTQEILLANSNLGPLMRLTFDNLIPEGRKGYASSRKLFKIAFEAARKYSSDPSGWLVLDGPSGSGKTHLAAAIAVDQIRQKKVHSILPYPICWNT
jgi:DNA replication protein DnaC